MTSPLASESCDCRHSKGVLTGEMGISGIQWKRKPSSCALAMRALGLQFIGDSVWGRA